MSKKEDQDKIIYKKLSYEVVGALFDVYNELGYGHPEKYYEEAIEKEFENRKLSFNRQKYFRLEYKEKFIGKYYIDFVVEDKIVLELKKGNYFSKRNMEQIKGYLQASGYKLAILANFMPKGVKTYRLLNIY